MTREEHLRAIYVTGTRVVGKRSVLVMLCAGPDCGGAAMLAKPIVADVLAEANAHIDKMAALTAEH
jgi:hypothetical protein